MKTFRNLPPLTIQTLALRPLLTLFLYSLLPLAMLSSCKSSSPASSVPQAMPAVPVLTAAVEIEDVPTYLSSLGTVRPSLLADIKPQVDGMLLDMHFKEGDSVEEGDLLFTIDRKPYEIQVDQAQAALAQNLARLKNAEKKLTRYRSLSKQDLIAKVEWEELETQVALAQGMLAADEARLKSANLKLKDCSILAPISGETSLTLLQKGNQISRAQASSLLTISKIDPVFIDFALTAREVEEWIFQKQTEGGWTSRDSLSLEENAWPVEVTTLHHPDYILTGTLIFLDSTIDSKSGMVRARAEVVNKDKILRAGETVRVRLITGIQKKAKLVPVQAVKMNQQGPYVFVIQSDSTIALKPVKVGKEEGSRLVVEEGLESADLVITEGHLRLSPGTKVENLSLKEPSL